MRKEARTDSPCYAFSPRNDVHEKDEIYPSPIITGARTCKGRLQLLKPGEYGHVASQVRGQEQGRGHRFALLRCKADSLDMIQNHTTASYIPTAVVSLVA